jgi:uncharacterized protein
MADQPISVIVDRNICPGNKQAFEKYLDEIIEAISHFAGYLDTQVIKPKTEEDHHYRVLFRFDTQKNLDVWLNSEERLQLVEKIDRIIEKPTVLQVITGLETWFSLPGQPTFTPPPRYKMAVVTWIAITPLLIVFNYLFGPYLMMIPLVPRFVVTTPWIVLIMTYLWMPFITKLFKGWLYPNRNKKA